MAKKKTPKGMHLMPNNKMMKNSEMPGKGKKMMKGKKGGY